MAKLGNTMYWFALGEASTSEWDRIGDTVIELLVSSMRFDVEP
jgi:hypothetical protein